VGAPQGTDELVAGSEVDVGEGGLDPIELLEGDVEQRHPSRRLTRPLELHVDAGGRLRADGTEVGGGGGEAAEPVHLVAGHRQEAQGPQRPARPGPLVGVVEVAGGLRPEAGEAFAGRRVEGEAVE
jgi:hypothetical protein